MIFEFILLIGPLLMDVVACSQYSCSSRRDGRCEVCDCKPDCFDLSDELNCTNQSNINDVLHPHSWTLDSNRERKRGHHKKFFPPPPLPPFPLCPDMPKSSPSPPTQTTDFIDQTSITGSTIKSSISSTTHPIKQTSFSESTTPSTITRLHPQTTTTRHIHHTDASSSHRPESSSPPSRTPPHTTRSPCFRVVLKDGFCRRRYRGYYSHPLECEKYIVCEWGDYHECQCPPLTRWNGRTCIWKYMSPCVSRDIPTAIPTETVHPSQIV